MQHRSINKYDHDQISITETVIFSIIKIESIIWQEGKYTCSKYGQRRIQYFPDKHHTITKKSRLWWTSTNKENN